MHFFSEKKFVGFSLVLLLIGFTIIVSASMQPQNSNTRAAQGQLKSYTGTGTVGRNLSQRPIKANLVLPIDKVDTYPIPPLTKEDITNYILGGSKGGTATAGVSNSADYMVPGTRMPNAGINEYQAAVSLIYYYQIKAHLAYTDVVFNFEAGDKVDDIVTNIASGSAVQLRTQEADTLLRVAVVYKGDACGFGEYNNPVMKQLLIKWGRDDLAGEAGVGETDIESIGLVAQAIDEEPDVEKRREWLAEIYVFYDNLHPKSPSGAVPELRKYQCSIDVVQDGTFDRLIDNYVKGIKSGSSYNPTPTPGGLGYPLLAPLSKSGVTPTFAPLGGGTPGAGNPTPTSVVIVVTPTPAPATPAPSTPPASTGLLQWIIQLLFVFILALFGR